MSTSETVVSAPVMVEEGVTYRAEVIGKIWMPFATCAATLTFTAPYEQEAEVRVDMEAGDFRYVEDFALYRRENCPTCNQHVWRLVKDWDTEDNGFTWFDCMYGHELE